MDRPVEAVTEFQIAVDLFREWDCEPLLRHGLEALTRASSAAGDPSAAKAAIRESISLLEKHSNPDLMVARARVQRARCHLFESNLAQAKEDLDVAWPVLSKKEAEHGLAGYQSGLANWWEATAEIRQRTNDPPGAIEAMKESVRRRQIVVESAHVSSPAKDAALAQTLHKLGSLLEWVGEDRVAAAFFSQSDGVRNAVGLPPLPRSVNS
jgi:hypothetical protein